MNKELDNTTDRPGPFISESAVRGAPERRTQALPMDAGGAEADGPTDAADGQSRASRPRRLRRWSVAELIAGAVARAPRRTGGPLTAERQF